MDKFTLLKICGTCFILYAFAVNSGSGIIMNIKSSIAVECMWTSICPCCNSCDLTFFCGGNCKEGYHGGRCYQLCPGNCTTCKDHSDTNNYPGYANCTKCKDGNYVTDEFYQCQISCPSGCQLCSSDSNCSACKDGYYGKICDSSCSIGCSQNQCNKESGECKPCKEYFNGSRCDACYNGKYGTSCSYNCPQNCLNQKCNKSNGNCLTCQADFAGPKCETCVSGKHGRDCSQVCPENCLDRNCNRTTGECFSCNGTFAGPLCEGCVVGKYGEKCNKACPKTCKAIMCHQTSGDCMHGCVQNYVGNNCSDCFTGYYGDNCNLPCPKNCNSGCSRSSGYCEECQDGFYGDKCAFTCPVNCGEYKCDQFGGFCAFCKHSLYGLFCNNTCPEHCFNDTCDQLRGTCTEGCDENFMGGVCDICIHGAYGENCNWNCPASCSHDTCRRTDGSCFSCKDNFIGTRCEECIIGSHGLYCNESCPNTCYGDECDRFKMKCTYGCVALFTGDICSECERGSFGQTCTLHCPANCENKTCDKYTGYCRKCIWKYSGPTCDDCISGVFGDLCDNLCPSSCFQSVCNRLNGTCLSCFEGFNGTTCDHCQHGRFGEGCNLTCPDQCFESSCDRVNGACTKGCNENFVGDVCDMCIHGKYGEKCSSNCSENCLNRNCKMDYGHCDACIGNFAGEKCDECVAGLHGEQCNDFCPDDCVNKTCGKETGHCKGCWPPKHGLRCELLCSDTCVRGLCHMVTAHCLLGCSPGYMGDLCDVKETSPWITVVIVVSSIAVLLIVLLVFGFLQRERRLSKSRSDITGDTTTLVANRTGNRLSPCTQRPCSQHDYMDIRLNQSDGHEYASIEQIHANYTEHEPATYKTNLDIQDHHVAAAAAPPPELPEPRENKDCQDSKDQSEVAGPAATLPELIKNEAYMDNKDFKYPASEAANRLRTLEKDNPIVPSRPRPGTSQMIEMQGLRKITPPSQAKMVTDKQTYVSSQMYSNQTGVQVGNDIIPLDHLAEYVAMKDDCFYQEEYLTLPKGLLKLCIDATQPQNLAKIRYNGIYPYDETRVLLRGPGTDFINASYVNGYAKQRQYIAAEGPTRQTTDNFETFWRMIWQEKVHKIVMLTNLMENKKMKCEQYWPNEDTMTVYGGVKVTCQREQKYAEFIIRTFLVESHKECRLLLHFHFTSWPDKAAPEEVTSIVELQYIVNATNIPDGGPIVVHCSAGIGQTGTFIALEFLTEQGKAKKCVDVVGCVRELRQQRTGMVQNWEQFKYIHQALVHSLLLDSDAVASENFLEHAADKELVAQTFHKLALLSESLGDDEKKAIQKNSALKQLNREGADIPGDGHRVRLYLGRANTDSDYINAVYLDSFMTKNKYILTQTPLRETVQDFLTLIVQESCPCIVTFSDVQANQNVGNYVPLDNKERLDILPAIEVSCIDMMETETYVKKTLMITYHTDAGNKTHEVSNFQFNGWPPSSLTPRSVMDFVQLVRDVAEKTKDNGGPILVHCLTGSERSGLFCIVSTLLERLDSIGNVSVVNAVKKVQFRRPAALTSQEQFEFYHEAVCAFLKMPMDDNDCDNGSSRSSDSRNRQSGFRNMDSNMDDLKDNTDPVYRNVMF